MFNCLGIRQSTRIGLLLCQDSGLLNHVYYHHLFHGRKRNTWEALFAIFSERSLGLLCDPLISM